MLRVLLAGLVLLSGCAADVADEPVCEAGKVEVCPCATGGEATQTCKSDGSGWSACQCAVVDQVASSPDVSCRTEVKPVDLESAADRCPTGKRQFLLCDVPIVQSGICYRDDRLVMYCCDAG
jgi:hypothetical protein